MNSTTDQSTLTSMKEGRSSLLWAGILSSMAGMIALLFPVLTSLSVSLLMGATFVIAGASGVAGAYPLRYACGFWPVFLSGLAAVVLGLLVLFDPLSGLVALTALIGAGLLVNGAFEVFIGLRLRPSAGWLSMVVSGILAIVCSILIGANLVASSLVLMGTLVGFNFLFSGGAYLLVWLAVGRASSPDIDEL